MFINCVDDLEINKRFTRMVGPTTAVYFAEILEVLKQVYNKKTFDPVSGTWKLNRQYIASEVGISAEQQLDCDNILRRLGILKNDPKDKNKISIDVKKYFELLVDNSLVPEELLPKTLKLSISEKNAVKRNSFISEVVKLFHETDEKTLHLLTTLVSIYYENKRYTTLDQWKPVIERMAGMAPTSEEMYDLVQKVIEINYMSIMTSLDKISKDKLAKVGIKLSKLQPKCMGTLDTELF